MSIGFSELLVIIILIIAFFKPDKLQDYVKMAASCIATIRETLAKAKEAAQPLDDIVKPVTDLKNDINEQVSQIKEDVKSINHEEEDNKL